MNFKNSKKQKKQLSFAVVSQTKQKKSIKTIDFIVIKI